jgi:methylaspartate mutase epsilon subunit
MELTNKKLNEVLFKNIQQEVLMQWETGKDVRSKEVIKYHENIAKNKVFTNKLNEAKKIGNTLIQPRAGVALVNKHIELLNYLVDEGEADLLPTTIDSYTRHNRYSEVEKGISESRKAGRSLLNGFPAVNHGVSLCRKVNESVGVPVQVRHGTPDARLLAEISIAGGFTSFEGGGISYNIPYSKNIPLDKTIYDWQYVDRLIGIYEQEGVSINREPFGPLTGTLVPPCISHSVAIIESLLAAEQGVKNITVGYGQCGNLVQDVAAITTLDILTEEYLQKFGYEDVTVTTVLHQWMGGFPQDESKAFGVISWGAATAALAGATKVIVKTPHEAMGVPTKEANASGIKATKQLVTMLKDQKMELTKELEEEKEMIMAETRCIINKTLELGKVFPARDNYGAVRFLECSNLPFNKQIKDYHYSKMKERADFEKRDMSFQMVIDDIYAIGKGKLVGRPR